MRLLALDFGSSSIKAVELDAAFGRFEIHDHFQEKILAGESFSQAALRVYQRLRQKPDKIVVNLRSSHVTFRILTLPTKDKKAIASGVTFELDDDLPFPIEDAVYDFSTIGTQTNQSTVYVASTLKTHIGSAIEMWNQAGLDPDIITTEAWALRALANRVLAPEQQTRPIVIVHIGNERTTLYSHHQGQPVSVRDLGWGGIDLTTVLCQRYGIPFDKAEAAKLDHGFVLMQNQRSQATAEQIEFSDTLAQPIAELISEIRQLVLSTKSHCHEQVAEIYLCGGTSLLPGLARVVEEEFQIPVHSLPSLSRATPNPGQFTAESDATYAMCLGVGLAALNLDKAGVINLRRGIFAKSGAGPEIHWATLKQPLMAVASILVCLIASSVVQNFAYQKKIAETDTILEKSVKSFFNGISNNATKNYLLNPPALKKDIEKELNRAREKSRLYAKTQKYPLQFLKSLSGQISKSTVVDLMKFSVGSAVEQPYTQNPDATVELTFLVDSPASGDRLGDSLKAFVQGLTQTQATEFKDSVQKARRYQITFKGKAAEAAYGK